MIENIFYTKEYETISKFYSDKRAKRSNVLLMNHINEGLHILIEMKRPLIEQKAFAIHPIVQNSENIDTSWSDAYELACEYKKVANSYLCRPENDDINNLSDMYLKVGHMSLGCAYNLLADKIQNQKDFLIYHSKTHNRKKELSVYFNNWITYLLDYIVKVEESISG